MRRPSALLVAGGLIAGLLSAAPPAAAAPPADPAAAPTVFVGEVTPAQLGELTDLGLDREDVSKGRLTKAGKVPVEVVLSPVQAAKLAARGVKLGEKTIDGQKVSTRLKAQAAEGYDVYRSYSEPGGIADELRRIARANPGITKLVTIGTTVQNKPILAIKLTKDARRVRDGARPSVLYSSAQHAREWITPEMNRRLLNHMIDEYRTDRTIRRVVDSTELWFVPVANPDGYDFTFTEGNRLWRKTLRDNNRDGRITSGDGVDPNRNWPYRWGYDNEGSSPNPASEVYRGARPASEPETRALDGLMRRIGFEFQVNYHSAAELLLYGVGWQVATPTPDDLLYETLAGDDANPAVEGYDPDIAAELYTTNGETTEHAHNTYDTLAYTPEMTTCQTASASDPDDAFDPADCESGFNFPDSEVLIEAEFRKNIPFALSIARSAVDPDDPVSAIGRTAPDFQADPFTVSYGDRQPVAVTARRDLRNLTLNYSINGRRARQVPAREWRGGERYGDEGDTWYAEFRGTVRDTKKGDRVRVWFSGLRKDARGRTSVRRSEPFTYRVVQENRNRVLVLADEDYNGVNPEYPANVVRPKYARDYVRALRDQGIAASTYDISRRGVPHHLGVLSHFDAVVWYLGDNRLTQDPEDFLTRVGTGDEQDVAVSERQQALVLSVRDYLNEGGRVLHSGETAAYYGARGAQVGGIFYGLDGAPDQDCVISQGFDDCLFVADDFSQYWFGAYARSIAPTPAGVKGTGRPLTGRTGTFGGPAVQANPLDEPGTFTVTSDILPPEDFPDFRSEASGAYVGAAGGAFEPIEGQWYVGGVHQDNSYLRLARDVDLRTATAAQAPRLEFALSADIEEAYDHVIVEARTAGGNDWTTLPEAGGATSTAVPADCGQGFLLDPHPSLLNYLTPSGDTCTPTGATGAWNSIGASTGGWKQLGYDLSAYAGQQVELSISYVTDGGVGGVGVFVDDARIVVGGSVTEREGFETGLGAWRLPGPPAGSPTVGAAFERSQSVLAAAVTTPDTVLLGFGVEQIADPRQRSAMLGGAVRYLLRRGD